MPTTAIPDAATVVTADLTANTVENFVITGSGTVTLYSDDELRYAYDLAADSEPAANQAYFGIPAAQGREIGLDPRGGRTTLSVWSPGATTVRVDRAYR